MQNVVVYLAVIEGKAGTILQDLAVFQGFAQAHPHDVQSPDVLFSLDVGELGYYKTCSNASHTPYNVGLLYLHTLHTFPFHATDSTELTQVNVNVKCQNPTFYYN